ncbi:MAG TPA: hypothetical protein VEB20_10410 [Azospirillaceae bacterium]|nr:hypothetical protein [Azospirillaceae bacterium]
MHIDDPEARYDGRLPKAERLNIARAALAAIPGGRPARIGRVIRKPAAVLAALVPAIRDSAARNGGRVLRDDLRGTGLTDAEIAAHYDAALARAGLSPRDPATEAA